VVAGREDECRTLYTRAPARSKPHAASRRREAAHGLLFTASSTARTLGG
jgi:hypothetical protein